MLSFASFSFVVAEDLIGIRIKGTIGNIVNTAISFALIDGPSKTKHI